MKRIFVYLIISIFMLSVAGIQTAAAQSGDARYDVKTFEVRGDYAPSKSYLSEAKEEQAPDQDIDEVYKTYGTYDVTDDIDEADDSEDYGDYTDYEYDDTDEADEPLPDQEAVADEAVEWPAEVEEAAVPAPLTPESESGEYRVGVDDILDINVIKPKPIASTVTVAPDGTITFPYIGSVQVKGLTLSAIQDEVQRRLADGYVNYPLVSVSLREARSKKFFVYGDVKQPGMYLLDEDMTLLRAITIAGGFVESGVTGKIKLLRPGTEGEIVASDIATILNGGYLDVRVMPGDTVVVTVDKFFVYGQVARPGAYRVQEDMTLLRAITVAGGSVESGATGMVKLLRPTEGGDRVATFESDITTILGGGHLDVKVLPGDTVVVTLDKFFVYGQVVRPGAYPGQENMSLLHAITMAGGFVESGATGTVKLLRPKDNEDDFETSEFDITGILSGKNQAVRVLPGDTVVVTVDKFFVYGEVKRPGMYPLEKTTTVVQAISMAGGFTKFGSASRVEVLRMNEATGAYDTIKVNMKNVMSGGSSVDVQLQPGDIVSVAEGMF